MGKRKGRAAYLSAKRSGVPRRLAKRRKVAKRRKGFSLNTHRFSRYCAASTSLVDSTELAQGFEFKFSDLLGSGEFTALFDRYKIDRVVTTFQLINNPDAYHAPGIAPLTATSTNFYPKMWYIHDYDDAVAEAIVVLKERVGVKCRILQPNKTITIVTKPAVAIQTYRTALTAGYGPKWNQYIDCAQTDVPHYGLKVAFDTNAIDPVDTLPFRIRVENKYYFTLKDVR